MIILKYILFALVLSLLACSDNVTNLIGYNRTLVLITDFEKSSEQVIKIIGSIRESHPDTDIQYFKSKDFDVNEASYLAELADISFKGKVYFAIIVDPGSNSDRIIYKVAGKSVLAPNNGVNTRLRLRHNPDKIFFIDNLSIFDNKYKQIKDIPYEEFYTEAIIKMLNDTPSENFGSICNNPINIEITNPKTDNGRVYGEVLISDNFGNCETNIDYNLMNGFEKGEILRIKINNRSLFIKFGDTYSNVEVGENICLINSRGRLELAINYASFASKYSTKSGTKIEIEKAIVNIGIIKFNSSQLVENIIANFKDQLNSYGFKENVNTIYYEVDAGGDATKLPTLINQLQKNQLDIVVPVSTPASKSAINIIKDIPIVYTYVTSPEFAGLTNAGELVTGLSDATNFDDYLSFVKELLPEINEAGRIYNPNEPNSAFSQEQFINLTPKYEIDLYSKSINDIESIVPAYNELKNQGIKTILIAADNTLNIVMKQLANKCINDGSYLIGDSYENAQDGALASISVDYDLLADATGKTVKNVLLGIIPSSIIIKRFPTSFITLNQITADKIGFKFSSSIVSKAKNIIK